MCVRVCASSLCLVKVTAHYSSHITLAQPLASGVASKTPHCTLTSHTLQLVVYFLNLQVHVHAEAAGKYKK